MLRVVYSWRDEFKPHGKRIANTFSGNTFAVVDRTVKTAISTSKVKSYPPNGYDLYDMAGNVWQWVADWYRADAFVIEAKAQAINPKGAENSYIPLIPIDPRMRQNG